MAHVLPPSIVLFKKLMPEAESAGSCDSSMRPWAQARAPGWLTTPAISLPARPQQFLGKAGLRLLLRSHEGPDVRELQPGLPPMSSGWSLDHETPSECGAGQSLTPSMLPGSSMASSSPC